ncbi:nanos homolog 1-like [Daphnia carinata]|uniref:nanos homolog 1-like n=1 Tax=Daphnia carinata TaxID=120202 RepID=UPI00257EA736|nr:nanos homolog 1-like [Daphnia carinata]
MIRQQRLAGRPLTKKSLASVKQSTDDDEGYGTCSPANSQLTDAFTFVKTPLCPAIHIVNKVSEDEWSALEKDLNRALTMQPLTECCGTKPTEFNAKVAKKPLYSLVNYGSKQLRVGCQFCAKNGELRSVVDSHTLRHPVTRAIICPVLRKYVCEMCGATGDNAHTKFYCPTNRSQKTAPTAILLKTTRHNATGKRTNL